jgi:uncharacterized membrane-anchored protein
VRHERRDITTHDQARAIDRYVKAGYHHIILNQVGPHQDAFCNFFERRVAPALRARKAA